MLSADRSFVGKSVFTVEEQDFGGGDFYLSVTVTKIDRVSADGTQIKTPTGEVFRVADVCATEQELRDRLSDRRYAAGVFAQLSPHQFFLVADPTEDEWGDCRVPSNEWGPNKFVISNGELVGFTDIEVIIRSVRSYFDSTVPKSYKCNYAYGIEDRRCPNCSSKDFDYEEQNGDPLYGGMEEYLSCTCCGVRWVEKHDPHAPAEIVILSANEEEE